MPLRVAVVGVGYLGRHHARIMSALPGVELVAVVDINAARAAEIAAAHGTRALTDAADLRDEVDAVTMAVPTEVHHEIARPFLQRDDDDIGRHGGAGPFVGELALGLGHVSFREFASEFPQEYDTFAPRELGNSPTGSGDSTIFSAYSQRRDVVK